MQYFETTIHEPCPVSLKNSSNLMFYVCKQPESVFFTDKAWLILNRNLGLRDSIPLCNQVCLSSRFLQISCRYDSKFCCEIPSNIHASNEVGSRENDSFILYKLLPYQKTAIFRRLFISVLFIDDKGAS